MIEQRMTREQIAEGQWLSTVLLVLSCGSEWGGAEFENVLPDQVTQRGPESFASDPHENTVPGYAPAPVQLHAYRVLGERPTSKTE